jgi:hypothetical protein
MSNKHSYNEDRGCLVVLVSLAFLFFGHPLIALAIFLLCFA